MAARLIIGIPFRVSIADTTKRARGRPRTGRGTPIMVRAGVGLLARVDAWIAEQPDPKPSRPEAVRRLVGAALGSDGSACD